MKKRAKKRKIARINRPKAKAPIPFSVAFFILITILGGVIFYTYFYQWQEAAAPVLTREQLREQRIKEQDKKCGQLDYKKLGLKKEDSVEGPERSPDCRHVAWSSKDGIFFYKQATGVEKVVLVAPYNVDAIFEKWKDRNGIVVSYGADERLEAYFNINNKELIPLE